MYFNNNKNNTNIDEHFNQNNNVLTSFGRLFSKYKKIILIISIVIILLIVMLLLFMNRKIDNYLMLDGEEIVTIYQGSDYVEPGYEAYNSKDVDLTNKVTIESNLNNDVIGKYEIIYKIGDITKVRYVNVIEKPKDYVFIHLTSVDNKIDIYLQKGDVYKEPGYTAISTSGKDLTSKVVVTGKVDTSKKGTYKLTYSVVDSNNVTISAIRKVIVMDSDISLTLNTEDYTNSDVTINAYVVDEYFDYMILPNNEKVTTNIYLYKVSKNGTYTFKVYNKKGNVKESSIEVKNIDKIIPSGSCTIEHDKNGSIITMNISDKSGISKYQYNNKMYTDNKIILEKYIESAEIIAYDKAGNANRINCKVLELKNELLIDTSHYTDLTGLNYYKMKKFDISDVGCTVLAGDIPTKHITMHELLSDDFHDILINICSYINKASWIDNLQHDGAYNGVDLTAYDYHSKGLAIDLNNRWTYTANGKKYRPYANMGSWAWKSYNDFVCEVCDGKEDCEYNVNYIIFKRYLEGNGWCWGGNWGIEHFDPMHFEIRENNKCAIARKQVITCDN